MQKETARELDRIIEAAAAGLFAAHDWPVRRRSYEGSSPEPGDASIVASIGFSGDTLCGALALGGTATAFAASLPPEVAREAAREPDRGLLQDWAGELSNQLLGRTKNKLACYGVDVRISVPIIVTGRALHLASGPGERRRYAFEGRDGVVWAALDVLVPPELVLVEGEAPSAGMEEGAFEMF